MKNKLRWVFVYISIVTISSFFISYKIVGEEQLKTSDENKELKIKIETAERVLQNAR